MARSRGSLWNNFLQEGEKKVEVDTQEVARLAYRLYEKRGREDGHDLEDWLKAEAIVRQRKTQGKS